MKIAILPFSYGVKPLRMALEFSRHLWNQKTGRTSNPDSPHFGLDDIWVRYAPDGVDGSQPHEAVWHIPDSILPVEEIALDLMDRCRGTQLGGVLITRIPPGATCRPHVDLGWHARHYEKVAVQIASAPGQAFNFHGESLSAAPGQAYWFDNAHEHWVTNDSDEARITMIVCIRTAAFDHLKEPA